MGEAGLFPDPHEVCPINPSVGPNTKYPNPLECQWFDGRDVDLMGPIWLTKYNKPANGLCKTGLRKKKNSKQVNQFLPSSVERR